MVFDHQAFFIEKREVNDKKLKGEDLWNNYWVSYGLPCFPNIETNLSFKKRKKDEIQVGLSTRDLLRFILPKERLDFLKRYKRY